MWQREDVDRRTLGDWTFALRGDEVADLRRSGRRVLRSIRAVVRDQDWNTATLLVDRVRATDASLTLHVRSSGLGSSFRGIVRIELRGDRLVVLTDLESEREFATNRTGIVVLHPPQSAGAALEVEHADGTTSHTAFPTTISPHQPVRDIARLAWNDDGVAVAVAFEGDVFEMEDQRNWTDASYKTYSRPLSLPFPYRVLSGERVVQSITVTADVAREPRPVPPVDRIDLRAGGPFPTIGTGASTAPDPAPAVTPLGASLLVELDLGWAGWPAALARASASGLPLDVRVVIPDADPASAVAAAVAALRGLDVTRVAAFQPSGPARHVSDATATALLRAAAAAADLSAPIVGGARSHFTELNREQRRLPRDLEGVVFAVTPLFHSRDTEQLVESLAVQRLVAAQAVRIAGAAPVHVGPVTLRPHFNDVATTSPPRPPHEDLRAGYGPELEDADDERQGADELAAWTVASAAALAVPGVASLSFFEEWGPRGLRDSDGVDRPVAAAFAALAGLDGTTLLHGRSPDGLVWALGGRHEDDTATVLVANLDTDGRSLRIVAGDGHAGIHLGPATWVSVHLGTRAPRGG